MDNENMAVALLSEQLALACGYGTKKTAQIKIAAGLHDIGKNRICPKILGKAGKLTDQEFQQMKMHTVYGADYLSAIPMELGESGELAIEVALLHHEKYDGSGYWGYKASALPRYIGIVSICDVLVALISPERAYKPPWTLDEALQYIVDQAGKQFCPELVNIFVSLISGIRRNNGVSEIFNFGLSA